MCHQQGVDADDAQGHALACSGDGVAGRLQHRAGDGDLRMVGDTLKNRLIKAALNGAQLQIGLAVDRTHRLRKLAQRRRIDELHRKRQRHAQHDGGHCREIAPRVVQQFAP